MAATKSGTSPTLPERREVIAAMTKLGAAALLPGVLPACATSHAAVSHGTAETDLIRRENARPGSRAWLRGLSGETARAHHRL